MWNGRSGFGCVLSVWLIIAATTSQLQAALFFIPTAGAARNFSTTDAAEDRSENPTAKVNHSLRDRMMIAGNGSVAEWVAPLSLPSHSELINSLYPEPSMIEDSGFLHSPTPEKKSRPDLATELCSTGIVASVPKDSSATLATMSRNMFEEFFQRYYLRTSRKIVRASLARSVEYKEVTAFHKKTRTRGMR